MEHPGVPGRRRVRASITAAPTARTPVAREHVHGLYLRLVTAPPAAGEEPEVLAAAASADLVSLLTHR